ncbi:MAG: carboxypeptidase regulatory-like domain-containing protein [Acidobacterium ailaaui]|nr:carboxypeptidase regulatory-like domain-containing protein [Pseudacidobacterium ailaaui]
MHTTKYPFYRFPLSIAPLAAILLLVVALCGGRTAFSQTDTARIQGTVLDQSGAAIPNATITLTNTDTGVIQTATSDSAGNFTFNALTRGNYTAEAQAAGFTTQTQKLTLEVSQVQALNFRMQPGAVSTSVTVTDAAPIVDTATSSTGAVIQGKQITELPLNGRNFTQLALLSPGVTRGAYGDNADGSQGNTETYRYAESGGAALSVNGLRPQSNNFLLDGIDNNESLVNTLVFFPPVDATQEFRITTSVAPAEFGRAGGAIIESSIKSGSNSIHGSLFEFYRSQAFDSNPNYRFFGTQEVAPLPFNRNQFGGSLGLPLIKDRLFAFGDYQGLREKYPTNLGFATVPTALMRTGNFSELLNPALSGGNYLTTVPSCAYPSGTTAPPSKGQIYDPLTCTPIPGNVVPPGRYMNQAALNYLNAFPLPNVPGVIENNWEGTQSFISHYNDFDVRLDFVPDTKDAFFVRYSYAHDYSNKTSLFENLPAGFGLGNGANFTHAQGVAVGYTRTFTPSVVNELRLGYIRDTFGQTPELSGIPVSANLGIVNANRTPELGGGALIGGYNAEIQYTGDYGSYLVPENTYEISNVTTWTHGAHNIRLGAMGIRREVAFFRPIAGKGYFFIGPGTGDYTGYEVSELLLGFVDNYQIGSQDGFFGTRNYEIGVFGQDDWRVSRRLTLNLGLRYDILTWPTEEHNRQAALNVATGTVMLAGANGIPRTILNNDYGDIGPRIGFAYDLFGNGKAALRGGYGMFYFVDRGGISNQLGQQPPFGGSTTYFANQGYRITFSGQGPKGNGLSGSTDNAAATAALFAPGYPNFDPANPPAGTNFLAVERDSKNSRIQQWNLQLEQQITSKTVADITYIGTKADHLSTYYDYNDNQFTTGNKNFPLLGSITWQRYAGTLKYNGLQTSISHRYSQGLIVTGAYTWSHALDNSPGAFEGASALFYFDPAANYGNSNTDQRNVASASILYELPFGRGKTYGGNVSRPMDWLIGGWQTNLVAFLGTGTPTDISANQNNPNRPDLIAPIRYPKSITGHWFDPGSFSDNSIPVVSTPNGNVWARIGTLRRNQVYGPGTRTVDFSLQKNLHLTERYNLELHGDGFNIFNTPQFTNPDSGFTDANFGKITGTRQFSNREIQLAARLTF